MASKKKQLKKGSAKTKTEAQPQQAPAGQQAIIQSDPGTLAVGDLRNLATIIDVASTRGAFRANEMATVGAMFNKLQQFLAKVAPEQKPEDAKAEAPATAEAKK